MDFVAAAVVVVGAVERLIDVSDEVDDPLERLKPLARRRGLVAEHVLKYADLGDDAVAGRAIATGVVGWRGTIRRIDRDIHEMPACRLRALRLDLIGPR